MNDIQLTEKIDAVRAIIEEKFPYLTVSIQQSLDTIRDKQGGPIAAQSNIAELWKLRKDDLRDLLLYEDRPYHTINREVRKFEELVTDLNSADISFLCWYVKEASDYRRLILGFSSQDFRDLYDKVYRAKKLILAEEDANRFFNRPEAEADFDVWMNYPHWKPEEACALSFGKDPDLVNSSSLEENYKIYKSLFRDTYRQRLRLIEHAISSGSLRSPIEKHSFSLWAEDLSFDLPHTLKDLKASKYVSVEEYKRVCARCRKLEKELEEDFDGPGIPKRETLLRMIFGMAVGRFEHRTDRSTNATADIEHVLKEIQIIDQARKEPMLKTHITVSNDKIRGVLNLAKDQLDVEWADVISWPGLKPKLKGNSDRNS